MPLCAPECWILESKTCSAAALVRMPVRSHELADSGICADSPGRNARKDAENQEVRLVSRE